MAGGGAKERPPLERPRCPVTEEICPAGALLADSCRQQAALARLRQAARLLLALDPDARGDV
jgi:hypothetical protein